ncbi:hypothetical protein AArc1_5027 (plasmid) [Natrarchaeobaculum sulfurireducens]|uniref:Uncharacterized protein n=1 Tax=Natrarchaeobaculum sulfurireducens TaxID=2044521 RepID=A0A346P9N3_9EURY|nr:hypothetical protein AArc1_5027 [Natrarchaeobaculum sulfurireducens]
MRSVFLIVSVSVEYPALLSAVGCVGDVGFILTLKGQVFSSNLYNDPTGSVFVVELPLAAH